MSDLHFANEDERRAWRARREARLLDLARQLNGEAMVRAYLDDLTCDQPEFTEWDTEQFERWLIGVMRRALAQPNTGDSE